MDMASNLDLLAIASIPIVMASILRAMASRASFDYSGDLDGLSK